MGHKRQKQRRKVRANIRTQIAEHVKNAFPGCVAEFIGQQSSAALKDRTFGFRVRESTGRYRSNIVWVNASYSGEISRGWVLKAVQRANG